jgi:hypothetical protein
MLLQSNEQAKRYLAHLQNDSRKAMEKPLVQRELQGKRMLQVSRTLLQRVLTMATLWKLQDDSAARDRAIRELLSAAEFADWNPSHFLDTAEMTAGMAIGYDWLFDQLSPMQRRAIRKSIEEKGLQAGIRAYEQGEWWTKTTNNWGVVCPAGMMIGALAIADENPELAQRVFELAWPTFEAATRSFDPDGGLSEGPGYWAYASRYAVLLLAAMETSLGSDQWAERFPGLRVAPEFRIHMTGPTGMVFNFADASEQPEPASQMFWLAQRARNPEYGRHERARFSNWGNALHLLWYQPEFDAPFTGGRRDARFQGVELAAFRSAWNDPNGWYVAFKGGNNRANHSHLDLGTFVVDALGKRWASDLGVDDYDLPGYFGANRYQYFRLGSGGQNVLTFDGQNQSTDASSKIVAFQSSESRAHAVADLSSAYGFPVKRGIALIDRRRVLIQDEFECPRPQTVRWNLQTLSKVQISDDGRSAILTQDKTSIRLRLLSPPGARFSEQNPVLEPPQRPIQWHRRVVVELQAEQGMHTIGVVMSAAEGAAEVRILPLAEWVHEPLEGN